MTDYTFEYLVAGRQFGDMPWRDPADPTYAYHIRERNVLDFVTPDGYEAVKINLHTGAVEVLQFWADDTDYDDYGACFDNPQDINSSSNLCGSITGTKIYQFAQSGNEGVPNQCKNRIIEFNKSDMSISKFFASSNNVDGRYIGVATCNAAGTMVARAGDTAANDGAVIELYRPADDAYGYINLETVLGITNASVGLHYSHQAPIAFDADGFLWVVAQPYTPGSPDRQNDESVLYKLTVTDLGGGALSLSLTASYTIPDEHYAWASSSGGILDFAESYGHYRFVFDHSALKFYLWSAWNDLSGTREGWFFEFNTSGAVTRGPLTWTPPLSGDLGGFIKLDSRGFSTDAKYAIITTGIVGADFDITIFDIASGTETHHDLAAFPNDIINEGNYGGGGMTLYHTTDGDNSIIYAFDVRAFDVGGWDEYQDGIFTIVEEVVAEDGFVGGSGAQMEPIGIAFELVPFALAQSAMNSCIELGPFRFAEQKQADETAQISSMILGLSQQAIGIVVEEDYMTSENPDEDWNEEVDQDGDDIYEDWSEGSGDSDDFTLTLRSTDDGINAQFQGDETLDWIEDFGSSKSYVPTGYSAIFHRVHICAHEVDEYWAVKTIDIAGVLTGRHL